MDKPLGKMGNLFKRVFRSNFETCLDSDCFERGFIQSYRISNKGNRETFITGYHILMGISKVGRSEYYCMGLLNKVLGELQCLHLTGLS